MTGLSWVAIFRLGLVQAALGAIVVLTTTTLNRVMVVEMALPAVLPGALVALHYAIQISRPRMGHGSDMGGRRTPWIVGGMAVLALGGIGAAAGTAWMASSPTAGILLAIAAFIAIGAGVGAAGTSLLVLLAKSVKPARRAAAATTVWLMMIVGFILTTAIAGQLLDPFTPARLVAVTASIAGAAFCLTLLAVWGVERGVPVAQGAAVVSVEEGAKIAFRQAIAEVWSEAPVRRFAMFVFISMLAYSGQDLILEPFAGTVFGLTPGQSTSLAGLQHSGVLAGMVLVGALAGRIGGSGLKHWTVGGCIASAVALAAFAFAAGSPETWPLKATVIALGFSNGAYAVAAIGAMMELTGTGRKGREGVRMGVFGAAQAIAFGLGGLLAAGAVDLARLLLGSPAAAYAFVFICEAGLFLAAAMLAARLRSQSHAAPATGTTVMGGGYLAGMGS